MTSHMLRQSAACPSAPSLFPHTIEPHSSHITLHTPTPFSPFSLHCRPWIPKPALKALWASWASARLSVRASSSESDRAADSGFQRKKLAVLVSGGGSNFRTLHEASVQNKVNGDFVVVISDKPACKACDYARSNGIPVLEYPHNRLANSGLSPSELVAALRLLKARAQGNDTVFSSGHFEHTSCSSSCIWWQRLLWQKGS